MHLGKSTKRPGASGIIHAIETSANRSLTDPWAEVTGGSYTNNLDCCKAVTLSTGLVESWCADFARMARKRWIVPWTGSEEKPAIYHFVARVVDKRFAFGPDEKEKFRSLMRGDAAALTRAARPFSLRELAAGTGNPPAGCEAATVLRTYPTFDVAGPGCPHLGQDELFSFERLPALPVMAASSCGVSP